MKYWKYLSALVVTLLLVFLSLFILSYYVPQGSSETGQPVKKEKRRSDKGIYITAWVAQTPKRFNYLKEQAKKAGINTIVVDAKDILSRPLVELIKEKKLNAGTKVAADPWL